LGERHQHAREQTGLSEKTCARNIDLWSGAPGRFLLILLSASFIQGTRWKRQQIGSPSMREVILSRNSSIPTRVAKDAVMLPFHSSSPELGSCVSSVCPAQIK